MKYGSLFSGTGALDMGVQSVLGGTTAWHSDTEKGPRAILAHHWPDVLNIGDIRTVDWSTTEPVDVITGGSPCQDVSHAGKRAGMRECTRSGLWSSMVDAIDHHRPDLAIWENVQGAHSARADSNVGPCPLGMGHGGNVPLRATGRVVGDLAEIGYDSWWCTLRAADAGAPHARARVFVFAWPAAADPHSLGPYRAGQTRRGWAGPADCGKPAPVGASLLPTPVCNDMGEGKEVGQWDAWTAGLKAKHGNGNGNGHGKSLSIEARRTWQDWRQYAAAVERWEGVRGAPAPRRTHPTPSAGCQLSARFTEWMMGLPDGHVTDPAIGLTRAQQIKALGNGVVPQQAALATHLWLDAMSSLSQNGA